MEKRKGENPMTATRIALLTVMLSAWMLTGHAGSAKPTPAHGTAHGAAHDAARNALRGAPTGDFASDPHSQAGLSPPGSWPRPRVE